MAEIKEAVKQIIDLSGRTCQPVTTEPKHFVIVPNDCRVESLEPFQERERPAYKHGNVVLFDVASFIEYFNLFDDDNSRIFANPSDRSLLAILDYHTASDGPARWGKHRASLTCETTDEWDVWFASNNKSMEQTAFALFIEDNVFDIFRPSGAALLEVARSLKARKDVEFASDVNLHNGQIQFRYHETIQGRVGGGEIEIPELFTLRFPIFEGGEPHEIEVRLRWRITAEKKLQFHYTMIGSGKLLRESFRETVEHVSKGTNSVVMLGKA